VTIVAPGGGGGGATLPAMTAPPSIVGETKVGSALTCTDGSWTGSPAPGFSRSWIVNGVVRSTAAVYTPTSADGGHLLRCFVTATNSVGSANAPGVSVTIAAGAPANVALPSITGNARQGSALSCATGAWSGEPTLDRQWLRDGVAIPGATGGALMLTATDIGHGVSCRVTAVNGGGTAFADTVAVTVAAADATPPATTPTPTTPTPPVVPSPTPTPTPAPTPAPAKPAKPSITTASVRATAAGVVTIAVRCPAACAGRLDLLVGTKRVGTAAVKAAAGKTVAVRVRLAAATARQLRTRGTLQVRAVAALGGGTTVSKLVVLRRA
jgi:hypothetical protein